MGYEIAYEWNIHLKIAFYLVSMMNTSFFLHLFIFENLNFVTWIFLMQDKSFT